MDEFLQTAESSLNAVQEEFDKYQSANFPERSPEFFCLELNGEAGELANNEKKQWKGREIEHSKFADEAADVLIALMNYSNARKINLGEAVKNKLMKIDAKRLEMKKEGKHF